MGLLDATPTKDGLAFTVFPHWLQGRTAYGGASAAVALTAAKSLLLELPPLRSAQLAFSGLMTGEVVARPTLLRRGRNTAFTACDLTDETGTGVRALFLFMNARASRVAMPAAPSPATLPPGKLVTLPVTAPKFMSNFDVADAGDQPVNGWLRWLRLRQPETGDPEVALMLIADALPPAALALTPPTGPVSTATWQVNVTGIVPPPGDWVLMQSLTTHAAYGASSQTMALWTQSGESIAHATQSVALFY